MRALRPLIVLCLLTPATTAAEPMHNSATDGTCELLVIASEDLTAQCATALAQIIFDDLRVNLGVGTAGEGRMFLFAGPGSSDQHWLDHPVDQVVLSGAGGPEIFTVTGACRYTPDAAVVTCDAEDADGRAYRLRYRSDGLGNLQFPEWLF